MKLQKKVTSILVVIISLVIMSTIIFLMLSGVLLFKVTGKYNEYSMNKALDRVVDDIIKLDDKNSQKVPNIIKEWSKFYLGINFDYVLPSKDVLYSTDNQYEKYSYEILIKHFSQSDSDLILAKQIIKDETLKGYLFAKVSKTNHLTIPIIKNTTEIPTMVIWLILFIIAVLVFGGVISLTSITSFFKRFMTLYNGVSNFHPGEKFNTLKEQPNDEVGKLASEFNNLVKEVNSKIEKERQYADEQEKFFWNISHDLRTPLTSIIGYSEFLEKNKLDNENYQYIKIIKNNAFHMNKLLSELIEFSKIKTTVYNLNTQSYDIAELCREILIRYIPIMDENGGKIQVQIPDSPIIVNIDPFKMTRVIQNLIDNAIKYGGNNLSIDFSIEQNETTVLIKIKDYGEGIDIKCLNFIFDQFYIGNQTKNGGLGLGLYIANEIVKRHNGQINVESVKGEYTLFCVELPKHL